MRERVLLSAAVLSCIVLVAPAIAQREEADVEWQKRHAKIEYNVVNLGRHTANELTVGQNWRMGKNDPSVLKSELAILVGDQVIVPGTYRVGITRQAEKEFAFAIEGGTVGDAPQGSPASVYAKGELAKPDKPAKNLEVTFKPDGKSTNAVQPAKITVMFGESKLVAPLTLVGTKSQKSGGWTLDGFTLPADLVEKRLAEGKPVPLAALKKESGDKKNPFHTWNLLVGKDSAELWPAPGGPAAGMGGAFEEVKGLPSSGMVKATSVKWEDAKDLKPFLEPVKLEVAKGKGATVVLAVGKQTCTISVPEPKVPE